MYTEQYQERVNERDRQREREREREKKKDGWIGFVISFGQIHIHRTISRKRE